MDLASLLGSTVTGGVLGGLFSLGNAAVEFVNKREDAKEKIALTTAQYAHELEMTKLNAQTQMDITLLQGKIDQVKASFEGLKASIDDQTALDQRINGVVLDIVALFRPGLTTLLVAGAIGTSFLANQSAFNALAELSAMAVAWWFGDRQRTKFKGKR